MTTLGKQIQSLRKQQQISQVELEERSGIKREYISRLERGKLTNPTINTLIKIAHGLEMPLENLLFLESTVTSDHHTRQYIMKIEQKISVLKQTLSELDQVMELLQKKLCA